MNSRRPRSLADYARAARRRKLTLLLPALVLAIAATGSMRELPSLFESKARLLLKVVKPDSASDLSVRLGEFRKRLASSDTLRPLVSSDTADASSSDAAILQMRDRITIDPESSPEAQTGAFTVSYRATDAETARKVTDQLASRLVALSSTDPSSAMSETEVLRKRAADISIRLRELEAKDQWLAGVRPDTYLVTSAQQPRSSQPSQEAIRAQQMTIESLKDQQYKIQRQLVDVDQRITGQRQIVEQQKKGSTLRDDPTYAVLIARRAELQGQRDTLINRQELTEKHPRVLSINDQIAAINRQIEELRQQDSAVVSQSPEARELAGLESERNRLKIDLEVTGRELGRRSADAPVRVAPPEASPVQRSATASKLVEQYLGLKRSYQDATSDLQNAESRSEHPDGGSSEQVSVLAPATLPQHPASPNRILLIFIAAAVGLALGAVFALVTESRRFDSLQDARDVEYYTRLPLLAALPKTATVTERRRAGWRAAARVALATATSAVATLALTKLLIAAEAFAPIIKK